MHNYADEHGRFPPAVVYGKKGQTLLSWRVLVLPYIEQEALYKQFHLDEPWDSPHNLALLDKMPETYAAPGHKRDRIPPYHTICHVFIGKGAAFDGREGRHWSDFTHGTSNTLLIVEAGPPVPWTKPEDLVYDPNGPLPELRGVFRDGFRCCAADGSAHWVPYSTSEKGLRAIITGDVEHAGPDWPWW